MSYTKCYEICGCNKIDLIFSSGGVFSPLTNNTFGSSRGHSSAFLSHQSPLTCKDVSHNASLPSTSHYSLDQKQTSLSSQAKEVCKPT